MMGLPITKDYSQWVQSEVGKGSTFTVRVPVVYQAD